MVLEFLVKNKTVLSLITIIQGDKGAGPWKAVFHDGEQ